MIGFYLSN